MNMVISRSEGLNGRHWHRGCAHSLSWHIVLLKDKKLTADVVHDRQFLLSQKHVVVICQIIWITLTKINKWISMYVFVAAVVGKWKTWHFKFRKVVLQHVQSVVGNMASVLLQISCWIQQWKTYAEVMHECTGWVIKQSPIQFTVVSTYAMAKVVINHLCFIRHDFGKLAVSQLKPVVCNVYKKRCYMWGNNTLLKEKRVQRLFEQS